jgi:hypothetical protein
MRAFDRTKTRAVGGGAQTGETDHPLTPCNAIFSVYDPAYCFIAQESVMSQSTFHHVCDNNAEAAAIPRTASAVVTHGATTLHGK